MKRPTTRQYAIGTGWPSLRLVSCLVLFLVIGLGSGAEAFLLSGPKWPQPTTTFYVDIPGSNGLWTTTFEEAMDEWGAATSFQFKSVAGYSDPCAHSDSRNGVSFNLSDCGDAWGRTTLAVTQWWYSGPSFTQTDIVFNSNDSWDVYSTPLQRGIYDFRRVAVHELGHALGLNHEDSGAPSIMRSYIGNITSPQPDDINGVTALYGNSNIQSLTAPGAPSIGTVIAGNSQATVSFTAPASNGGSAITGYTATSSPSGITASGPASPLTIFGLANGAAYTFTVTASNAIGTGPSSLPSASVIPSTVPGAPTIGIASPGDSRASVAFLAPAANGGSAITGYTATSSPSGITASGPASPLVVTGLSNGIPYSFTVTATNGAGTGPASGLSNPVTPQSGVFTGKRADYVVTKTSTGYTVTGANGLRQTVSGLDKIQFADGSYNILIADNAATLTAAQRNALIEIYLAYFNRVPEAEGLDYWIDRFKAGQTLDSIANDFYTVAVQYASLTGYTATLTNDDFVKRIYANVLSRSGSSAPSQSEISYWSNQLAAGLSSRGRMISNILAAAHSYKGNATWGWVPDLLDNKIAVGNYCAITAGIDYLSPDEAISKGMTIAAAVTPTDISAALALTGLVGIVPY